MRPAQTLVPLCPVSALAVGEMKAFDVEGLPPVALFNFDGTFYATGNVCTHQVALLTDGYFEGDTVECPMHGGSFNVCTGKPTNFPCTVPLPTFELVVQGGQVFIQTNSQA